MRIGIVWFRRDLRLGDNPALTRALNDCGTIVPVYVHAPQEGGDWRIGSAAKWWLHHSLKALDGQLRKRGSRLILRCGPSFETIERLAAEIGAACLYWNRVQEPYCAARDEAMKARLRQAGRQVQTFNGSLLCEPETIKRADGAPYRVFTHYRNAFLKFADNEVSWRAPTALPPLPDRIDTNELDSLGLLPGKRWEEGFHLHWKPGEKAAHTRLRVFVEVLMMDYRSGRDHPARGKTSRLSPHLHFGEISPRQVRATLRDYADSQPSGGSEQHVEAFERQLIWREFSHYLLHHFPHTAKQALDERFQALFRAQGDTSALLAWRKGLTGYPLVDAGMRELWASGWMHNRARLVVASFLTKNLGIPWQTGAEWFWDTLVDADLANNTMGWQWTAGCGADAAPYFRVFNPVLQGERFDPDGTYVRRWLPELARLPGSFIHKPWQAPQNLLGQCGLVLGKDYPAPIVNLKASRERALAAFRRIKQQSARKGPK